LACHKLNIQWLPKKVNVILVSLPLKTSVRPIKYRLSVYLFGKYLNFGRRKTK